MSSEFRNVVRFMPTYRLEPTSPFNKEKCEKLIKSEMDTALGNFMYNSVAAEQLALNLSETILAKVKDYNFDRYKFISIVTIGEKYMQGFCDMYRCLWDTKSDDVAVYVFENKNVFAVATLHCFYFH